VNRICADGKKIFKVICDECMAELDKTLHGGMWTLDCGHHLCTLCEAYSASYSLNVHRDKCPKWKIGSVPSESDEEDQRRKAQVYLAQKGYKTELFG
jgi:hypothetical protein